MDLIETLPLSILNILDEECRFPKATEKTFAEKLYKNHMNHPQFEKPRIGAGTSFTIKHYADKVTYDTNTFIDKNKDFIIPDQLTILSKSSFSLLQSVFKATVQQAPQQQSNSWLSRKPAQGSSFQFSSVGSQFKESLAQLMNTINKTYPHYIRCIKPNPLKQPNMFYRKMVLHQLKCGGILESIRICLEGYPSKKLYKEFYDRYLLSPHCFILIQKVQNFITRSKQRT